MMMGIDSKAFVFILIVGASVSPLAGALVDCSECGEGDFLASPCNETAGTDRECKACSLRCGEGITECRPDGQGDALCKQCNFDTDVDIYIQRSSSESEGYGYCKFCSSCRPDLFSGTYLKTLCHGHQDNVCETCSECNDDEIEVSPCTSTSDRKCEPKGALKPDQEYYVAWAEMQACDMDSSIKDLDAFRAYLSKEYSPSGEGETLWDLIHAEQRTVSAPHDLSEVVEDIYWPQHRDGLTAVSEVTRCAKGGPKGCCCKARATWRFQVRMEEKDHAIDLIRDLKRVKSTEGFCVGLSDAGVMKGHVDEMEQLVLQSDAAPGSSNAGKVVGYLFLTVILLSMFAGGVYAWRKRDKLEKYLPESWKKAERLEDEPHLPESTTPAKDVVPPFGSEIDGQNSDPMETGAAGQFKSLNIDSGSAIEVTVVTQGNGIPDGKSHA